MALATAIEAIAASGKAIQAGNSGTVGEATGDGESVGVWLGESVGVDEGGVWLGN